MKTYREQYDELRFSPEEKQAMVENLLAAAPETRRRVSHKKRVLVLIAAVFLIVRLSLAPPASPPPSAPPARRERCVRPAKFLPTCSGPPRSKPACWNSWALPWASAAPRTA